MAMRQITAVVLLFLVAAIPAGAQETRGTISGTVHDAQGVIPGAPVKIVNTGTNVSQDLVTNSTGYFEAPFLVAGSYKVTVEMPGFKTLNRTGITLGSGAQITLDLGLDLGTIQETVTVTGEAPLLETTNVRAGLNLTTRELEQLPTMSNMPVMLARFAPGMSANSSVNFVVQGFVQGPSETVAPLGGVGGAEYSIDGATNNGVGRRMATSPNADMIQEMRVETTSFTASAGHGVGVGISLMTRAGTNQKRGTANYQGWTNRINSPNYFQKLTFATDKNLKAAFQAGRGNDVAATYGAPVQIPKLIDGTNKLFMFLNLSITDDVTKGGNRVTLPRNDPGHNHVAGDFSDLLLLPNPSQYIIYDPLTTRPDPARPGHVIRDPFPNNIIPPDRIANPFYKTYTSFLPQPNLNPSGNTEPSNNYFPAAQPDPSKSQTWGARFDYNQSQANRYFVRVAGSHFTENQGNWTFQVDPHLHETSRLRTTNATTGTWTHVTGQTVLDAQMSYGRFLEFDRRLGLKKYTPASLGLPQYMTDLCLARDSFYGCQLPTMTITGYQSFSNNSGNSNQTTNKQAQLNFSQVRGAHTIRAGADYRWHIRETNNYGTPSGNFTFDTTYVRKADDTTVSTASNVGLSWASFMLGLPTQISVDQTSKSTVTSPYLGTFVQDAWRLSKDITLTVGLRYEWEDGVREQNNHMIVGFDPNAPLAITDAAQAAYARSPLPEVPASAFTVAGGPIFANSPGQSGKAWPAHAMWMPRGGLSWSVTPGTVVQGGYGLYFDTLNAGVFVPNTTGYSATTTTTSSVNFGQTFVGDARNGGIMLNPFPVRPDGTRFDSPIGSSLGVNTLLGSAFSAPNLNHEPARVQRWRVSVQREITRNISLQVAYNGMYSDRIETAIRQDYLPEQYYNGSNMRDPTQQNFLNANVVNPFYIGNFGSLQTTNPALYSRMQGNSFFTSPTIQRNRLLRPFPEYAVSTACSIVAGVSTGNYRPDLSNCLAYSNLPLGKTKTSSVEITLSRRFANGMSGNFTYTGTRAKELTTVEEYDRAPWLWLTSQDARPHRIVANGVIELPLGRNRRFLSDGGVLGAIVGGWQSGLTFEYQPGALLQWNNNVFFYGNLGDIPVANPTIGRWFNVDAGFERDPNKTPASYQKRAFPFRVDGVRSDATKVLNMNVSRNIPVGHSTLQLRIDALNLLNRNHFAAPNLDPASAQFGTVTANTATINRFVTFVVKLTF
jgi:hypothetical protein